MRLLSDAFQQNAPIPKKYTCEGEDVSPPLYWQDVPREAESLALVIEDPDAPDPDNPQRTWTHWVVYNIPAGVDGLPEGVGAARLPDVARQAANDFGRDDYGGPCPPIGKHRYFHRLYALDTMLDLPDDASAAEVEAAMAGHVVATAELVGLYEKHTGLQGGR